MSSKRQKIRINFEDGTEEIVFLGAFAQIAAKRAVGLDALRSGDPEAILYGSWVELKGVPKAETAAASFDRWLQTIDDFGLVEEDDEDAADPPLAESSGSSLASPPTSDSIPSA